MSCLVKFAEIPFEFQHCFNFKVKFVISMEIWFLGDALSDQILEYFQIDDLIANC